MKKWILLGILSQLLYAETETTNKNTSNFDNLKKWYEDFWNTLSKDPNEKSLSPNSTNNYNDLILRIKTGYGKQYTDNETNQNDQYSYLITAFNNCAKGMCLYPTEFKRIKDLKLLSLIAEQCYANIRNSADKNTSNHNSEGLNVAGISRNQTKLEKELDMECKPNVANTMMQSGVVKFTPSFSVETDKVKTDLRNYHNLVQQDLNQAIKAFIIKVNNTHKIPSQQESFINKSELSDKSEAYSVINAFNDLVKIKQYLPPIKLVNESNKNSFFVYGSYKKISELLINNPNSDINANETEMQIGNNRDGIAKMLQATENAQNALIKSYTIMKKNAILNMTNLIDERTKPESTKHSSLFLLEDRVNSALKENNEITKPAILLRQIRDAINTGNKLNYLIYQTEERIQMALAANQLSQLKPLADKINDNIDKITRLRMELELGSEMIETGK